MPALLVLAACGDARGPAATTAPAPSATSASPAVSRTDVVTALRLAAIAAESYHVDAGVYPPDVDRLAEFGYTPVPGVAVDVLSPGKTYYCLKAHGGATTLYYSSDVGKPTERPCR